MVDYKFSKIVDNGKTKKYTVRFYEGDVTTEKEMVNNPPRLEMVTRYRRLKILGEKTYEVPVGKTLGEIRTEVNDELSLKGDPIDEQNNQKINAKGV